MGKKADEENTKKAVVFLEKKINYIFNTFLNVGEEDARIAKKNWFCLSCDRKLNTFTGKIGDFIPSPGMKGAKLNSTISLGTLLFNLRETHEYVTASPGTNSQPAVQIKIKAGPAEPATHNGQAKLMDIRLCFRELIT